MTWQGILVACSAYVTVGCIIAWVALRLDPDDLLEESPLLVGLTVVLWPVFLVSVPIWGLGLLVGWSVRRRAAQKLSRDAEA